MNKGGPIREWACTARTAINTGDLSRQPDRLILSGMIGSLRWWYEVLVRGLGGKACDPTSDVRCPDQNGRHCVVCELFGCTGWARKFRLMILDDGGRVIQDQIQANQAFILRFIPLRPIAPEEWCLLDATLRLIADYGAMGGKTVFKPSDEPKRENVLHHQDFGLIVVCKRPPGLNCTRERVETYVRDMQDSRWRKEFSESAFPWASLQNFWCVKGRYLARQDANTSSFNRIIGRHMRKNRGQQLFQNTGANRWLAGRQQESKKVFSFKHLEEGGRTFGFVKPGLVYFNEVKRRLRQAWNGFQDNEFLTGAQILNQLFQGDGGA
ncbi:MAG: hypothetical protein KatS3mg111_3544 [Pirellulaceae bacterium]|nr:MAG: hypothetical protein KatS3mg111_3544 [Pirellulaceae bacterium]